MKFGMASQAACGFVGLGVLLLGQAAPGAAQASSDITFTRDIAPILQENCQTCHRPESIAPMSLLTYEEVRPWARVIKLKVETRKMPPWPIDKSIGVQDFKNDISLSDEEIALISAWVDVGAPQGNPEDMPAPKEWPSYSERWAYEDVFGRKPDLIIASDPYMVGANGLDHWPEPETLVEGLDGPRWIRAVEVRPGTPDTRYVFHHANPDLLQDGEDNSLVESAVGTVGFIYPADSGKLIKPGSSVRFNMHLYPTDRDVEATLQIGLWFYPEGETPNLATEGEVTFEIDQSTGFGLEDRGHSTNPQLSNRGDLLIPPNSQAMYRGVYVMDRPARIHSLRGHMHLRGKYQVVELIYPDGRWEVLNKLDWDHPWHTAFLYDDDAMPLLPKGTVVVLTSLFDNTAENPYNPDPRQWVAGGDRTVDEMSHLRMGITYFDDEAEFEALVRERERINSEKEEAR